MRWEPSTRRAHQHLKTFVAVKVLPSEKISDADAVSRFYGEMQAIGRVEHPNVVRATDAREVDGQHFLVMELVDGIDLSYLIEEFGPLQAPQACGLIRQAALGLVAIHECGLIHRDIKPSNLALSRDGTVKILDLGLAKLNTTADVTATGQVMGTIDYMPKEQVEDSKSVDIRADIYSLGCTLYKLLTGEAPYRKHTTVVEKLQAICHEEFPALAEREDITDDVRSVLERMTAKEASARYQTPSELTEALSPLTTDGVLDTLVHEIRELARRESESASQASSRSICSANVATDQVGFSTRIPKNPPPNDGANILRGTAIFLVGILFAIGITVAFSIFRSEAASDSAAPAENSRIVVREEQVGPNSDWSPMFVERPKLIAWRGADDEDQPVFDAQRERYSVRSPVSHGSRRLAISNQNRLNCNVP